MSMKQNDVVIDFLMEACEDEVITIEKYKELRTRLGDMPSAEEIADDHIQIEVEEHIQDQIDAETKE